LAAFAVLIWLGTWQLQRKTEKEALIEAIGTQLAAPPMRMPEQSEWETLSPVRAEFRRVRFQGEFLHGQEALVYTSGSAFRPDVKGPGYWVFTPVRTVDGDMVAVNRGFVPDGKQNPKARADGQIDGVVTIVGTIRWPERRGRFTPNDDPAHNIWYTRDHVAMAAAKNWGNVAPFYIEQESPAPPGGLPQVGPTVAKLPNNHLQYAITWYGLALVLVVAFFFWTRARLRERREAPP
jgi:surfeit locus 1 family protein